MALCRMSASSARKVVGDPVRHLAQLQRLLAVLTSKLDVDIGERDEHAVDLVGHNGGADRKCYIAFQFESMSNARMR